MDCKATVFALFAVAALAAPLVSARLTVKGKSLLDASGMPFVLRGVNYPYTWFKNDVATAISAIAKTGANSVRVVLGDGAVYAKDDAAPVRRILDLCRQNKLVAVLEVHDTTGLSDLASLKRAAEYFISLKAVLAGTEDRVIINIANEWTRWAQTAVWAQGYSTVIPLLRKAGFTHVLAVDGAGWGQDVSSIVEKGLAVAEVDTLKSTIFDVHMYEVNAPTPQIAAATLNSLLKLGVPFFVGEFSNAQGGKNVAYQYIMEFCEKNGIGWMAWSWYGNAAGNTNMNMAASADGRALTNYGKVVVDGTVGLRKTSKKANIKW